MITIKNRKDAMTEGGIRCQENTGKGNYARTRGLVFMLSSKYEIFENLQKEKCMIRSGRMCHKINYKQCVLNDTFL